MKRHLLGLVLFVTALFLSYNLILRFDLRKPAACCG
jgi:hypothetical protein